MVAGMRILVMAKSPVPGRVKTRLCPPCTFEQAAAIAEAAIADTLDAALATGLPVVVALDGPATGVLTDRPVEVVPQGTGSFGERLEHAWGRMTDGAVQIGMDTPQVTAAMLLDAVDLLARHAAVLGFAHDGGWWCLGLHRPVPGAFHGVPMSTTTTGARQYERLTELRTTPALLTCLRDVDAWSDACDVARRAPHTRFARAVASMAEGPHVVAATRAARS